MGAPLCLSIEVRQELKNLYGLNNYRGTFDVFGDWFIISTSIFVCHYLWQFSFITGIISYPIAVLVIGSRMRALTILLHASTHKTLAKSWLWNNILGGPFSGWTVFMSWTGYCDNHIRLHHAHLGNPDKDPDYQQMLQTGLYAKETTRKDVVNYIKNIPSARSTFLFLIYLIRDRIFPCSEFFFETVLRTSYWIIIFVLLHKTNSVILFFIFWIVPTITTANWISNLAELLEHFPLMNRTSNKLLMSRNKIY